MIQDFTSVCRGADLVSAIRELRSAESRIRGRTVGVDEHSIAMEACLGNCHVCGGRVEDGPVVWESFADYDAELPAHAWCHDMRSGMAGASIRLSISLGNFIVKRACKDVNKTWRRPLLEAWSVVEGPRVGAILQHGPLPGWNHGQAITGDESFTMLARLLFIHERERVKWRDLVPALPLWDAGEDWKAYWKRYRSAIKGRRLRATRSKGLMTPEVAARTGGSCALCGDPEVTPASGLVSSRRLPFRADHIRPHDKGGTDDLANLQPLHDCCNGTQGVWDRSPGEIVLGVSVGRWLIELVSETGVGARLHPWAEAGLDAYVVSALKA